MKIIIVALSIFLLVIFQVPGSFGVIVTAKCPLSRACPFNPTCLANRVLIKDSKGCCCRSACGQDEVYGCGCADKACNAPQIVCKRCTDGCFCRTGYVRDKPKGKCIPEASCPRAG